MGQESGDIMVNMQIKELEQREKEFYDEGIRRREREKEEQEENENKAKLESSPERKKRITLPEKNKNSIVELDKSAIAPKELEINREVPEIKEKVKIEIPIVELDKHVIAPKELEINREVPEIKEKVKIEIPIVELDKHVIAPKKLEIDREILEIKEEVKIEIPIVELDKHVIAPKELGIDKEVPETKEEVKITIPIIELSRALPNIIPEERRIISEEEETSVVSTTGMSSTSSKPSSGREKSEEIPEPDIVDFVFGVSNSKISSKGPKIVLYKELDNDSTIGSFETLCIKIYREKVGGNPRIQPIKKFDEFNIREIEKWVEANKRIITIDLDSDKKRVHSWFREENLRETLRRDMIGDVGFIIFKTRDGKLYEHCKKVLENLKIEIEHPLNIVYAKPNPLSFEKKKKISSLAWGNVNLDRLAPIIVEENEIERRYGGIFDDIFNKRSKSLFEKRLEELEKEDGGIYVYATEQHEGEESSEHLQMKWFIVKLLSKEQKLKDLIEIEEIIKTEEEYEGLIPDIRVDDSVYEVETLFAEDREGKIPKKKIDSTIRKYESTSINEINIILDNLTFLRHLRDLTEIRKVLKGWATIYGKKINFYTLDIQNSKLLPLGEVIKKIKNL